MFLFLMYAESILLTEYILLFNLNYLLYNLKDIFLLRFFTNNKRISSAAQKNTVILKKPRRKPLEVREVFERLRRRSPLLRRHTCWMRLETPAASRGGALTDNDRVRAQSSHIPLSPALPWLSRELWAKLREWMTEAGFSDKAADIFCGKSL